MRGGTSGSRWGCFNWITKAYGLQQGSAPVVSPQLHINVLSAHVQLPVFGVGSVFQKVLDDFSGEVGSGANIGCRCVGGVRVGTS